MVFARSVPNYTTHVIMVHTGNPLRNVTIITTSPVQCMGILGLMVLPMRTNKIINEYQKFQQNKRHANIAILISTHLLCILFNFTL